MVIEHMVIFDKFNPPLRQILHHGLFHKQLIHFGGSFLLHYFESKNLGGKLLEVDKHLLRRNEHVHFVLLYFVLLASSFFV